MESIIPLILFTYPGAISECVYRWLDRDRSGTKQNDEIIRVAWDFFLSALVTALCLVFLHPGDGTLSGLMEAMKEARFLWTYLALSLGLGAMVGVVWFLLKLLVFRIGNWHLKKHGKETYGRKRTIWQDLLEDPTIPHGKVIAAVYRDGVRLRAGIVWEHSTDIGEDPALILIHTDEVEQQLDLPEEDRTLVSYPVASYIEPASGLEVQIYDGKAMDGYIQECTRLATSSAESSAEEPSV